MARTFRADGTLGSVALPPNYVTRDQLIATLENLAPEGELGVNHRQTAVSTLASETDGLIIMTAPGLQTLLPNSATLPVNWTCQVLLKVGASATGTVKTLTAADRIQPGNLTTYNLTADGKYVKLRFLGANTWVIVAENAATGGAGLATELPKGNTDIVAVVPYDTATSGAPNFGGSGTQTQMDWVGIGQTTYIRQLGTLEKVRIYVPSLTGVANFYVKVWRKNATGTYDLVGVSADIRSSLTAAAATTVDVNIPGVAEGDAIGGQIVWSSAAASAQNLYRKTVTANVVYYSFNSTPASADYNWEAQTNAAGNVVIEGFMRAPYVVAIGDSITAGAHIHNSYINTQNTYNNPPVSIIYKVGRALGVSSQNFGIGGQTSTVLAARFAEVVALKPKIILLNPGGINSANVLMPLGQFIIDTTQMLDAAQAAGVAVILQLASPWLNTSASNGTTEKMRLTDQYNAWMKQIAPTYSAVTAFDPRPLIGKFRPGGDAGNLWDLRPAFAFDDVHLTEPGNEQMAMGYVNAISQVFIASLGVGQLAVRGGIQFSGDALHSILTERASGTMDTGAQLQLGAGGAPVGTLNGAGGTVKISGGISTGSGKSAVELWVAASGAAGTADNLPLRAARFEADGVELNHGGSFFPAAPGNFQIRSNYNVATANLFYPATASWTMTFGSVSGGLSLFYAPPGGVYNPDRKVQITPTGTIETLGGLSVGGPLDVEPGAGRIVVAGDITVVKAASGTAAYLRNTSATPYSAAAPPQLVTLTNLSNATDVAVGIFNACGGQAVGFLEWHRHGLSADTGKSSWGVYAAGVATTAISLDELGRSRFHKNVLDTAGSAGGANYIFGLNAAGSGMEWKAVVGSGSVVLNTNPSVTMGVVNLGFAVNDQSTWRMGDWVHASATSNAAVGFRAVVGGQVAGGIAFQRNASGSDSGWPHLIGATSGTFYDIVTSDAAMRAVMPQGAVMGAAGGPTVTSGVGIPASTQPNGSIFLRSDGTGPNLYVRENGAWVAK